MSQPFFSIGITTYNRPELLKRCLASLAKQSFGDFEVIIGNDYVAQELSIKDLGIDDPRFKIINHKENLGERQNLNFLLSQATGKYFTWQFDDDFYSEFFLEKIHSLLIKDNTLSAVFTSYKKVFNHDEVRCKNHEGRDLQILDGQNFVADYLKGRIKAMGLTGMFETNYLRSIGGAKQLNSGPYALYSEYLLLINASALKRVGYVSSPMVFYYVHNASWGNSNVELDLYKGACQNLYEEGAEILKSVYKGKQLESLLFSLLKFVLHDYYKKCFTLPVRTAVKEAGAYTSHLYRVHQGQTGNKNNQQKPDAVFRFLLIVPFLKTKLKMLLPASLLIPLQKAHSRFQ